MDSELANYKKSLQDSDTQVSKQKSHIISQKKKIDDQASDLVTLQNECDELIQNNSNLKEELTSQRDEIKSYKDKHSKLDK